MRRAFEAKPRREGSFHAPLSEKELVCEPRHFSSHYTDRLLVYALRVPAKGGREPIASTVKAVLEGHDCGFFRNLRELFTVELASRDLRLLCPWWHKRCSVLFED
jgi:hypothetical protein